MDPFLPAGQVTGIGSLPHLDPEEAVAFVAQFSPAIPFWPQLPQRSPAEGMISQMLSPHLYLVEEHGPARFEIKSNKLEVFRRQLREAEAGLEEHTAAGFFTFERACRENRFPNAAALKCQVTGPMTLASCLFHEARALSTLPDIHDELVDYVCRLAAWQISRLAQFDKPVILFIDEPTLALNTSLKYLTEGVSRLIAAIRKAGAHAGVHCCATPAPVLICDLNPDIISFDAHQGLELLLARPEARRFVEAKGCVSFGLIPTLDDLENFRPSEALIRWAMAVEGCSNIPTMAEQSFITATCGLGLVSLEAAQASFIKAKELSQLIVTILDNYKSQAI